MKNIASQMENLVSEDGFTPTHLPGIGIFKASEYNPRQPLCYKQGIIIIGQGEKRIFFGNKLYEYNADKYLVLTVPLPAECETFATKEKPLLALIVDIDIAMLNRIISQMDEYIDHTLLTTRKKYEGMYLAETTSDIKDTVSRLLTSIQSPLESSVLGPGLVYELIFRIMCGENAASLYGLAMKNTNLAKIDKALKLIHAQYQNTMNVETLANTVNMSPSAFHRVFSDVTSSSPIQYIKKIRLSKAKELLMESGVRVGEAASNVGYESAAQFSREFKRYYGSSPSECNKDVRR